MLPQFSPVVLVKCKFNFIPRVALTRASYQSLLCSCIFAIALCSVTGLSMAQDKTSMLKAFITDTAPVYYYRYDKEIVYNTGHVPKPPIQTVEGRWANAATNWVAFNAQSWRGVMGTMFWESHAGFTSAFDLSINRSTTNSIASIAAAAKDDALLLLRLGLAEVDFAGAEWTGPSFRTTARMAQPDNRGVLMGPVEGVIMQRDESLWEIMVTNTATKKPKSRVITKGKFENNNFIPIEIERYEAINNQPIQKVCIIKVHAFEPALTAFDETLFDPVKMEEIKNRRGYSFFSNDVQYTQTPFSTNRVERIMTLEEAQRTLKPPAPWKKITLISLVVTITFLMVSVRRKWRNK
jgi:hypothetical protein